MIPIDASTTVMLRTHLAQQNEYMISLGEVYKNQNFVFANLISNMLDLDHVSQGFKRITVKAGHPKGSTARFAPLQCIAIDGEGSDLHIGERTPGPRKRSVHDEHLSSRH